MSKRNRAWRRVQNQRVVKNRLKKLKNCNDFVPEVFGLLRKSSFTCSCCWCKVKTKKYEDALLHEEYDF